MSLSKFYKQNTDFQATSVLNKSVRSNNDPVWGSIVKKESEILQESIIDEALAESLDIDEISETEIVQEPTLKPQAIEEDAPAEPPPPPVPPEVTVDIAIIEQNAFASGIEAGKKQAEEDFENSAQTLLCICTELDSLRETILRNSSAEMKELVLAISEKIIRHSVREQEKTIVATIKDAINLAVSSDEFAIQINPEDLAAVQEMKQEIVDSISGLDNIVLKADPTLERGGCKLESTCCTVDASMTSQIKVVHDSIMASESLSKLQITKDP